jgi:hypothetical protein
MLGGKLGFLADQLADPEVAWSLGAFAIAWRSAYPKKLAP